MRVSKVLYINGSSGAGESTTVKVVLNQFEESNEKSWT
jgi:ABC-type ATPase involved in cell division